MKTKIGRLCCRGWMALWLLLTCMGMAQAQTRAWLDRESISLGETVILNIETDQSGQPDYGPLRAEFDLSRQNTNRQMQMSNGTVSSSALFSVALSPRRNGELQIPALRVGNAQTAPLRLVVAQAPLATRDSNALAFVETTVDDTQPYVQQTVGVVVRLYFATQLASGELVLDTPAGASLQRVGEDATSTRDIGGRRYNVVERRFMLVPERSGALQVPGARFSGQGVGGFFDDFLGRDSGQLSARAPDQTLQVRAVPANASQPWLPLKSLQLRYTTAPNSARTGEAANIVVEATATGVTKAQFPDLPVPSLGDAAQVFAEPPQYDESFVGGSPQLKLTRRYSVVPQQTGPLTVPGIRLGWWDVRAGQAQVTALPDLQLQVEQGSGGVQPPPVAQAAVGSPALKGTDLALAAAGQRDWLWPALAAGFALLWLVTLIWGLSRRRDAPVRERRPGVSGTTGTAAPAYSQADLRRALDAGGLDEVVQILAAMAGVRDLDAVLARLGDAGQRQALERMQGARWAGQGDVSQARAQLREAFRAGPRWRDAGNVAEKPLLDPLYPGQS